MSLINIILYVINVTSFVFRKVSLIVNDMIIHNNVSRETFITLAAKRDKTVQ